MESRILVTLSRTSTRIGVAQNLVEQLTDAKAGQQGETAPC
jgi:hypothetical protein